MQTVAEWQAEGERLFGEHGRDWKFVCPVCGTVQSGKDFKQHTNLSIEEIMTRIAFSCIGRVVDGIGCDYTTGGLLNLSPVKIVDPESGDEHYRFAFEEPTND